MRTLFSSIALALLLFSVTRTAPAQIVCTDAGCFHIDGTTSPDTEQVEQLMEALERIDPAVRAALRDRVSNVAGPLQRVLEPFCLFEVAINPESRVKVDAGPAKPLLTQGQWKTFLIKVQNAAGVTAPLRAFSDQASSGERTADRWIDIDISVHEPMPPKLTGQPLEYRLIRLRTESVGKRSAVIAMDVGQGTADIGFRNDVLLTFRSEAAAPEEDAPTNSRLPRSDEDLRRWLENMVWHHGFSVGEVRSATGLSTQEIEEALMRWEISSVTKPKRTAENLLVLPYPGGRHPRIGFLEGAIDPQRETKLSIFTPWDDSSYVVLDAPEAVWSNLGLTYLAHTHIPTLWDLQDKKLQPLEWLHNQEGILTCERTLPNGIAFGVRAEPTGDVVELEMWLENGTPDLLTDLRVQMCAMLKATAGFESQTNENKIFWGPYSACRDASGSRWIILAWDPVQRAWGNADCPCLHSDPQLPDCPPGETARARGILTFFEGTNIYEEFLRLERTDWRRSEELDPASTKVEGAVIDAQTGKPIPARLHIQDESGRWFLAESIGGNAVQYDRQPPHLPVSREVHTTLSADPFRARLPAGNYTFRVERGKDYVPLEREVTVGSGPLRLEIPLQRWIDMAERGWYSGDTHVHRAVDELPNAMLAEDLNVALPVTDWLSDSGTAPRPRTAESTSATGLIEVDATHAIYATNTEYEITRVNGRNHLLGAFLVLNHKSPLTKGTPPVGPVAREAQQQGALIDLEKHSWPWSMMLVPVMDVDLYELSNNHIWQTQFGFTQWMPEMVPEFLPLERDEEGLTERGWIEFGMQTYYTLLNCGYRLRVSAGTATGVHPVQLGFGRVYVHLPEGFRYDRWIEGLDAGRSFVSTGPMLEATFNEKPPGSVHVFEANTEASVQVTGVASSLHPLDRIEVIVNGRVEELIEPQNTPLPNGGYESSLATTIHREGSFWTAVRCFEQRPDGRVRFAHTNPAYADVSGKTVTPSRAEVGYLIQRMEEEIESNRDALPEEALDEYRQALSAYRQIAEGLR